MVLRSLLLALMVFVVMPWGAFSAVYPALAQPSHVTVGDASQVSAMPATFERPHKRCRTATLPGSPCGQDLRLNDSATLDVPARDTDRPVPHDTMLRSGVTKPPPQGPPRLI
ncbi:hypothetical protein SULPSESMR1_03425 [Pseudosulfitobacter pseudonitzschiae]|uniref:Uncharacterized protein n=1 Tax=Pseudosulfitobacter pseudonitzschiae TaxID=1402135 RepID=A0A221K5R8_9RHOB|nr:hypothetical protein SULPSESMR1_03425 [Pseudosulfitobacter pseudonitzschiae]